MAAFRLTNVQALAKPDIINLLRRSVDSGVLLAPHGFESIAQDIFNFVADPSQFMVLGAEKGEMKGVVMGFLPVGNLFPYPTLVMFYNEGSRALSREMQDVVLDILLEAGYTRMLAVNSSGRPDEVWARALTPSGATSEKVGSLYSFEVR